MKTLQAYKFKLITPSLVDSKLSQFAGCCRFVWNKALNIKKEAYESTKKSIGYCDIAKELTRWKKETDTQFLADIHSQVLQQSLKDLEASYKNFFRKNAMFPRFKKKGIKDSFRYPQGFKIEQQNNRIYLPKIGYVRYINSRTIEGKAKNITISKHMNNWYVSIQVEKEIELKEINYNEKQIGLDVGISKFAYLSNGEYIDSPKFFKKYENKIKRQSRRLSKKVKFSNNWKKAKVKLSKIHTKISNSRKDFLHKTTTNIANIFNVVAIEELKVKNMSKSAKGTVEKPGENIKAKSGLNKSILDQSWSEFKRMLEYKLNWQNKKIVKVNPQYTSQKCSSCGFVSKENRKNQAKFFCESCGYENNADYNASINILAAGLAVLACGDVGDSHSMKQEPPVFV